MSDTPVKYKVVGDLYSPHLQYTGTFSEIASYIERCSRYYTGIDPYWQQSDWEVVIDGWSLDIYSKSGRLVARRISNGS